MKQKLIKKKKFKKTKKTDETEAKSEAPAAEAETEAPAPEKKEPEKIDYVPDVGVKIIRRAADEPAPVQPKKKNKPNKWKKSPWL